MRCFARDVGLFLAVAFVGIAGASGPAHSHESDSHLGYVVRRKVAATRQVNAPKEIGAPNLRSISGNIFVLQDDGTMIENDLFVLNRVLPAFTAFLPDSFDFLNIFGSSAFADSMFPSVSEYIVRNHVAGLGMSSDLNRNAVIDISTKRLKSIQLMNDIRHYGPTPTSPVPRFTQGFTGVELLGSEVMHATGCHVRLDTVLGIDLLGRLNAHWSFFLSTEASVMEGCTWIDNGNGTFTSGAVLNGFSELDEYLFGLRPSSTVSPMFFLDDPDSMPGGAGDASFPFPGFTTGATRVNFTINDIIAQNGPRVPSAAASPHHFTMAFLLVAPQGISAPAADLLFLEQFRQDWEAYFALETEFLGSMTTTLPLVAATASFTADRIAGTPPLQVQFLAEPEGSVNALFWDFGDGSPLSSQPNPAHTYTNPGVYNAKLTVLSSGPPSAMTRTIRVGNFPSLVHEDFEEGPSGWQLGAPNTAPIGQWEWGEPEGTQSFGVYVQPDDDATQNGTQCWVTDKEAGSFPADKDVDGGVTTLVSPPYDLSAAQDPYVSYSRWYSNSLAGFSDEDVFLFEVSTNNGVSWVNLESTSRTWTSWQNRQYRLRDFVVPTASTRFRLQASDLGGQSLVEAAFDEFLILDVPATVGVPPSFPEAASESPAGLQLFVHSNPFGDSLRIAYRTATARPVTLSVVDLAGRRIRVLFEGTAAAGNHEVRWDGFGGDGERVATGTYILDLSSSEGRITRKVQKIF